MYGFNIFKSMGYFLLLNLVLNYTFRISPLLGILVFGAFIFYSLNRRMGRQAMWGSTQFRTGGTTQQQTYQQPKATFQKDPHVIDAEFQEHKPN